MNITKSIKDKIDSDGIKIIKLSEKTKIPYQRLIRIFNQGAVMSAVEFLILCGVLNIDPNDFKAA